jgi:hypothetical protein
VSCYWPTLLPHDLAGRRLSKDYTGHASGPLSRVTDLVGKVVGRTYDDRGQLATLVYDGMTIDTRAYDDGGRMTSSSHSCGVSESITGTVSGYGFSFGSSDYDNEARLVNWQRSDSNLKQAWNLSLVGNWTRANKGIMPNRDS